MLLFPIQSKNVSSLVRDIPFHTTIPPLPPPQLPHETTPTAPPPSCGGGGGPTSKPCRDVSRGANLEASDSTLNAQGRGLFQYAYSSSTSRDSSNTGRPRGQNSSDPSNTGGLRGQGFTQGSNSGCRGPPTKKYRSAKGDHVEIMDGIAEEGETKARMQPFSTANEEYVRYKHFCLDWLLFRYELQAKQKHRRFGGQGSGGVCSGGGASAFTSSNYGSSKRVLGTRYILYNMLQF